MAAQGSRPHSLADHSSSAEEEERASSLLLPLQHRRKAVVRRSVVPRNSRRDCSGVAVVVVARTPRVRRIELAVVVLRKMSQCLGERSVVVARLVGLDGLGLRLVFGLLCCC